MFDYINTKYEDAQIVIKDKNSALNAIKTIIKQLRKSTNKAELYCYLSKAFLFLENNEKSLKYARKAIKLDPKYLYAQARIAFARVKLNQDNTAIRIIDITYRKMKKNDFLTGTICFLVLLYVQRENYIFKNFCKKYCSIFFRPKNKYEYEIKIIALIFSKKFKQAEKLIKKIEELGICDSEFYRFLSSAYYHFWEFEIALQYAQKAIKANDTNGYYHEREGWALYKLKRNEALTSFLKAEELGEKSLGLYSVIADLYYMSGEYKKAIKYANKIILLEPQHYDGYFAKGTILYELLEYKHALKYLEKAEELGCNYIDLYSKIAYIHAFNEHYKKSYEYINKLILIDRDNSYAYYLKGWILFNMEDYEKAKKNLLKAEDAGFNGADLYQCLGYIFYISNENEKALEYINKSLILNKNDAYSYDLKGSILLNLGKTEDANKCFKKSAELE